MAEHSSIVLTKAGHIPDHQNMRNIVLGSIVTIFGAGVLIGRLVGGGTTGHYTGAYGSGHHAGEVSALPIAIVFLIAGVWAIRKGIRQRHNQALQ